MNFFRIEKLTPFRWLFRFGLLYVPFFQSKCNWIHVFKNFALSSFHDAYLNNIEMSPILLKWFFCILKKVDHMCRCKKMIVCKNCSSIANSKSNYCFLHLYINLVVLQWNWPQNGIIINSQISLWWQRWYKKKCNFCSKSNSSSKMNFFQTSHF